MAPSRRRPPAAVLLVAGVLAAQSIALLWLAVDALAHVGGGVLPSGAQVFLAVLYLLLGVWVGAAAVAMVRGRAWSRGATTAVQLFAVLLSWWLISMGAAPLGAGLLVLSGAALIALFTGPVTQHLSPASDGTPAGADRR